MMPLSLALSLLVAPAGPPTDTWQAHEAECRRLEDEIKAPATGGSEPLEAGARYIAAADACRRAFEAVPAGGKAMDLRSYFVFEAHRLYQLAHDAGSEAALCADAQALDIFAAQLAELKPGARARDRRDVVKMRAQIEAQLPGPCLDGAAEGAAPEPLLPVATIVQDPVLETPVVPVVPQPLPRVDLTPLPSARRPLRIAGGAALGLGLGLGAGMIAALVRGASLRDRTNMVSDAYKGQLIPEPENGQFELDKARGQRADSAAIGLGIAGGLLAVVGVSLLVVDARDGRAPRRVAMGPILPTAGLRLALEF
jgi:hypothetical protein